jgi:phosphatidylinositol alpha-1,6-mannosyltransferase
MRAVPRILLGLEGLAMDGGVASVSRCFARALDEAMEAGRVERADRILLHDTPAEAPPPPLRGEQRCLAGSKLRFVWELHRMGLRHRHDWVLFDHVGVARAGVSPLPGAPRRRAVMVHGGELEAVTPGSLFERSLLGADRILTNSHFTARNVAARVSGVEDRIRPLRLCVEPSRIAVDAPAGPREPAALIVGRMWPTERGKGHDALIRAWPAVRARVPDAVLWVVGGGEDRPRLEVLADERGVADAIHFLGRLSDEALAERYRRARVFAMPSRQEGFGLVYAEAMWHGLACVGSTSDAAAEVIVDGVTGRLAVYDDERSIAEVLVELLEDPARAEAMGRAGRRRVEENYVYPCFRDDFLAALDLK